MTGPEYQCTWCTDTYKPFTSSSPLGFCSNKCYNNHLHHAAKTLNARMNGDTPPPKAAHKELQERARKWTPEKMRERIRDLKENA